MNEEELSKEEINEHFNELNKEAESSGYHLNPDTEFTRELVKGLLVNKKRYGYQSCPCRIASGVKEEDLDIICPCDYRDPDLAEYDTCYCSLYVSGDVFNGKREAEPIPERRPTESRRKEKKRKENTEQISASPAPEKLSKPVWRCKVCGYLCANDNPPGICPICKAKRERFERFI